MNYNKPYENKRSEQEQQASQYILDMFGEDWISNQFYKQHEEMFMKMYSLNEKEVRRIFRKKRAEHRASADFLLSISPIVYCCILINKGYYKDLIAEVRIKDKEFIDDDNDTIYTRHIKEGSRFAKKCVLADPLRFSPEVQELVRTCKEPMTYQFKKKDMVGNIM